MRTMIRLAAALFGVALLTPTGTAWACEKCFGAGGEVAGITMAMLSLILMTGVVFGGIGAFFVNMYRRAEQLAPGDLVVTEAGDLHAPSDDV